MSAASVAAASIALLAIVMAAYDAVTGTDMRTAQRHRTFLAGLGHIVRVTATRAAGTRPNSRLP